MTVLFTNFWRKLEPSNFLSRCQNSSSFLIFWANTSSETSSLLTATRPLSIAFISSWFSIIMSSFRAEDKSLVQI